MLFVCWWHMPPSHSLDMPHYTRNSRNAVPKRFDRFSAFFQRECFWIIYNNRFSTRVVCFTFNYAVQLFKRAVNVHTAGHTVHAVNTQRDGFSARFFVE